MLEECRYATCDEPQICAEDETIGWRVPREEEPKRNDRSSELTLKAKTNDSSVRDE